MRKFIFIVLSVLLLLSLTGIAYAIHAPDLPAEEQLVSAAGAKITLGGRILVRGWYFDNVDFATGTYLPVETTSQAQYTTNAYLVVNAKLSDNLQAYMELETSGSGNTNSGLYTWGTLDTKPNADLFFRELWLQYTGSGLLGVPAGIKVGHMLLTLGEKQFLNHERFGDDAIILFVQPTKELHLAALTVKLNEGTAFDNTNDIDYYGVLGVYKLDKNNTIGANYSYVSLPDADLQFQNLGFHANGLIASALTYAAELDFQFGDVGDPSVNFKGWGFMAKAGYKIDPVNLRASFAIGSGDNDPDDDEIREFQTTVANNNESPLARFVHYTQIYERTVRTSTAGAATPGFSSGQILASGTARSTGIANTTYYNLGADVMATKDINLSLDGFLLRATKTVEGSKSIGSEIDLKASYKITKNLTYFVEAGAFWTGDFYQDTFGIDNKDVTQVVHGINLTF